MASAGCDRPTGGLVEQEETTGTKDTTIEERDPSLIRVRHKAPDFEARLL